MRHLPLLLLTILSLTLAAAGRAQSIRSSSRPHQQRETLRRYSVSVGAGASPAFLLAGSQQGPVVQLAAQRHLNERLALGVAFAQGTVRGTPFVDYHGVESTQTTRTRHFAARLRGSFVRQGALEVYGGLHLGLNVRRGTATHVFPEGMSGAGADAYIAERPSPFSPDGVQVSPVGFIGASFEVHRGVALAAELGNNLALANLGVEFRF